MFNLKCLHFQCMIFAMCYTLRIFKTVIHNNESTSYLYVRFIWNIKSNLKLYITTIVTVTCRSDSFRTWNPTSRQMEIQERLVEGEPDDALLRTDGKTRTWWICSIKNTIELLATCMRKQDIRYLKKNPLKHFLSYFI
jgi:hypothetical protein